MLFLHSTLTFLSVAEIRKCFPGQLNFIDLEVLVYSFYDSLEMYDFGYKVIDSVISVWNISNQCEFIYAVVILQLCQVCEIVFIK